MLARALAIALVPLTFAPGASAQGTRPVLPAPVVDVVFSRERSAEPLDGRLLLLISTDSTAEPRFQISDDPPTQQVFGTDVEGWRPGRPERVGARAFGYPLRSLSALPRDATGCRRCSTATRPSAAPTGTSVKLPPDKGEGQQWNRKPGNLYSTPRWVTLEPASGPPRRD